MLSSKEKDKSGLFVPAEIIHNKDLTDKEKLFLSKIVHLDNKDSCYANNQFFADYFNVSRTRVSQIINSLNEKGYIQIRVIKNEGNKRFISTLLKETLKPYTNNFQRPIKETFKHNKEVNKETKYGSLSYLKERDWENYKRFTNTYKSKIENWEKFKKVFNNKCIKENIPADKLKILARAETFAINWIERLKPASNHYESEKLNESVKWFIDKFNQVSGREYVITDKIKQLFDQQMNNGFTGKQMIKAVRNLYHHNNEWHRKRNYEFATPEFILKDDNLNKFLNTKY